MAARTAMTRSGIPAWTLMTLLGTSALAFAQGQPLGPEFRVNTHTTDFQVGSSVASDSAGNFVVTWRSDDLQDGSNAGVFAQRYDSTGAPLGGEFRVNTYTTGAQSAPSAASDPAGNIVVVWTDGGQDGSQDGVFGQRYDSTGVPLGGEFRVSTYTTSMQAAPSVASDAAGNFVVTWHSYIQDGSGFGIFAQRYAATGAPMGAEFRINLFTTGYQEFPSVASDSAGNFVVTWNSYLQDGSGHGVFARRFASSGTPLGGEFRVNTFTTNHQRFPAVAADSSSNFVVTWISYAQDGSGTGVFAQRYDSTGTPLGGEIRVNTFTTSDQRAPSVASDPAGNFVVVWMDAGQEDGSQNGVFGQRYTSTGSPLGGEFRVNTYTTSSQSAPSVASDAAGNFVVTWDSYLQDGSGFGVFGQRYGMIVPVTLQSLRVE